MSNYPQWCKIRRSSTAILRILLPTINIELLARTLQRRPTDLLLPPELVQGRGVLLRRGRHLAGGARGATLESGSGAICVC